MFPPLVSRRLLPRLVYLTERLKQDLDPLVYLYVRYSIWPMTEVSYIKHCPIKVTELLTSIQIPAPLV